MSDQPQNLVIPVMLFNGSAPSNDGQNISISFTTSIGVKADLTMPVDRAVDLMTLASDALGKAAQNREKDADRLYILPTKKLRFYETPESQTLILSFVLLGGAEMCFRVDTTEAQRVHEALGVLLGLHVSTPIPETQKN